MKNARISLLAIFPALVLTLIFVASFLISADPAIYRGTSAISADLSDRDPQASPEARRVYAMLVDLEDKARAGRSSRTIIGQHVELQNERYNPRYGDYKGLKQPGYYYRKVADITGRLPGFTEVDLGPGYGQKDWGVGASRSYSRQIWPTCQSHWGYTNDAMDLMVGVWAGLPRPADGSYDPSGSYRDCTDGSAKVTLPINGSGPAGIVGMSFHEPYPGSSEKGYDEVLCRNSPAASDPGWLQRVVTAGTAENHALLYDLSFLADHLKYLADQGVPVLFRPYHEMNVKDCKSSFWWAGNPRIYKILWRTTYDYLVNIYGLHNLIFVWSSLSWHEKGTEDPQQYFPGSKYVDAVGVDVYGDAPDQPYGNGPWTRPWYEGLASYGKPRMVTESSYVPLNRSDPMTLENTPWAIWTVWGAGLTSNNSNADVKRTYYSPRILAGTSARYKSPFDWRSLHQP